MSDGRNHPPVLQLNPADPLVVATRGWRGDRSGRCDAGRLLGYGEDEFAPWHLGATL